MAAKKSGDPYVQQLRKILREKYGKIHPRARIDVKRYNSVSVRVRIIDPDFEGKRMAERDAEIWDVLKQLPEDIYGEVSLILPFTPQESKTSHMNEEFEHPTPSPF
jgi:hypothetical protein